MPNGILFLPSLSLTLRVIQRHTFSTLDGAWIQQKQTGIQNKGEKMGIKIDLKGRVELGLSAIAILALAGCGGGGSSGSATCSATGNVSGAEAVNCFFAEAGASWNADLVSGLTNWAGTSSVVAKASTRSLVATGVNSYTYRTSAMDLATSSSTWTTGAPAPLYYLAATGWESSNSISPTYTNNGNGTFTTSVTPWYQGNVSSITRTDLTGQPVACTNPLGSYIVDQNIGSASSPLIVTATSCPVAVTYPAGSASYTATTNATQSETYLLVDSPTPITLTDGAGVTLSGLPGIGTRFCMSGFVYDPIAGAVAKADNYNVFYSYTSSSCTLTNINAALGNPKLYTALIGQKATGNAVVPNLFDIKITFASGFFESICAFHLGKLMCGSYQPATTSTSTSTSVNKTAANAQLKAAGLPMLP